MPDFHSNPLVAGVCISLARKCATAAFGLALTLGQNFADWPQFLGPHRNGSLTNAEIDADWSKNPPEVLWKTAVGAGFAGPVTFGDKVLLFHRRNNEERLSCYRSSDGRPIWEQAYPATYRDDFGFDDGPRATPAIAGGSVFTLGADGVIQCVELETGRKVWAVDAKESFGARKGFFGFACSPLVLDGRVVLNVGGAAGGIVALDAKTGKVHWRCGDPEASYASPVPFMLDADSRVLVYTREGLSLVEPQQGKILGRFRWRPKAQASVNASSPLVIGEQVFISASYETGAALLEWKEKEFSVVWSGDDILSNHYATSIHHDGFLYGFDGRQEQSPAVVCVEAKTGKPHWRVERFGAGTISLLGKHLLLLKETGELVLAAATQQSFQQLGQAHLLGNVRAYPALGSKTLYARDKTHLFRVEFKQ